MFGLTFEKLLVIAVIAAFIIGPERLPAAAEKLRDAVRWARGFAGGAKERLREEMGDEFDDVDWRKLDPRQYDPRRIIREALLEDEPPPTARAGSSSSPAPAAAPQTTGAVTGVASGAEVSGPALAAGGAAMGTAAATTIATAAAASTPELSTPFDPEAT